jgi:hypothetical protein
MPKIQLSITATVIALVIISLALTFTTFAALNSTQSISSTGVVTTSAKLGVYSNFACTTNLTSINWGTLNPGGSTTQIVYIKNIGSGLSLHLNMTTSDWSVGANGPITLTWNREGTVLAPGQSTTATLTLAVSSSIDAVTDFNVQININGSNPN